MTQKTGAHRKVDSAELALAGERLIAKARQLVGLQEKNLPRLVKAALRAGSTSALKRVPWEAMQLFRDGLFLLIGAYPDRLALPS